MRLFEILLLLLLLTAVTLPLLPLRWRRPSWTDWPAAAAAVLLGLHLLLEGYRWQMIPAYLLTAVLFILFVWGRLRPISAGRAWVVGGSVAGILFTLLSAALAYALPVPELPDPTGPYAIGTTSLHLIDNGREEIYSEDPNDPREIMVQIWYPAPDDAEGEMAPFVDDIDTVSPLIAERLGLPGFLLDHLNLTETSAILDAPLLPEAAPYPVVVFSHGLNGLRTQNTSMMQELASHGYVAAAIDHPYANVFTVFPDGRVILYDGEAVFGGRGPNPDGGNQLVQVWAADISFLLDEMAQWQTTPGNRFHDSLNLVQIGVFGHSTGGGTAVEFCLRDERCRAGIGLDSWVEPVTDELADEGLPVPFLFINTPAWLGPDNAAIGRDLFREMSRPGAIITIAGTEHFDFSNLPLLSPLTPQLDLSGPIDSAYNQRILHDYLIAFFDRTLQEEPAPLLNGESPYPEVTVEWNGR